MGKPTAQAVAKAAPSSSNQLATINEAELFGNVPVTGMENVTSDDLLIPRLTILQALSPQLQERKPEYIPDAKAGMFCDVGTGEVFTELELLPCFYVKVYLEWAPRASGKGLVHNHGTDRSILSKTSKDEKNRNVLPNGNYIADTATFYCLNLTAGGRRSFVPLSSTQMKSARRWLNLIKALRIKRPDGTEFEPPIFYQSWSAEPTEQSNNEGDWFGWKFMGARKVMEIDPTGKLLQEAMTFAKEARDGIVVGDVSQEQPGEEDTTDRPM